MNAAGRLTLDMNLPRDHDEADLLNVFRESCSNDKTMLFGLLDRWATLTPPQRGALYRVADLFVSANGWRRREVRP